MSDPSISDLRRAEQDARVYWNYVRDINKGYGKEAAAAARVAHELALIKLNRALRQQNADG